MDDASKQDLRITYHHMRVVREEETEKGIVQRTVPRGTICYIRDEERTAVGVSLCSDSDNFSYKLGRQIAFGRAAHIYRHVTEDQQEYEDGGQPPHALRPISSPNGMAIMLDIKAHHPQYGETEFFYTPLCFKEFVVNDPEYRVVVEHL